MVFVAIAYHKYRAKIECSESGMARNLQQSVRLQVPEKVGMVKTEGRKVSLREK